MDWIPENAVTTFQIKWFVILYILTFIPCWVSLILSVKAIAQKKKKTFFLWSIILILLLSLPYLFVLINVVNSPWQLWTAGVILFLVLLYKILFSKNKISEQWFWDWYSKSYDNLWNFTPYRELISSLVDHAIKSTGEVSVLDVGCGTGNMATLFKQKTHIKYLGIDASDNMLARAKKKFYYYPNIILQKMDIEKDINKLNQTFDVIICNNILYTLIDHESVIIGLVKLLKKGGKFIISEPLRGSSIKILFINFIKKEKLKAFWKILIHFPSFLLILVANIIITNISHIKEKNFFSHQEIINILEKKDLHVFHSGYLYEDQNLFLQASK